MGYIDGMIDCIMSFRKCEIPQIISIENTVPSVIVGLPFSLLLIDFKCIVYLLCLIINEKAANLCDLLLFLGRDEATRTPDPYVPNVVRYQLRYIPMRVFDVSKSECKGSTIFSFLQIFLYFSSKIFLFQ